jgi:hypothetical protein
MIKVTVVFAVPVSFAVVWDLSSVHSVEVAVCQTWSHP